MFMIMLVLNDTERCQEILDAWDEAGAPGVTIFPSTGLGRMRSKQGLQDDMPLMPSLKDFMEEEDNLHRTIITFVRGQPLVDKVVQATQTILGDLNQPNTGILVVLPVLQAFGLDRNKE